MLTAIHHNIAAGEVAPVAPDPRALAFHRSIPGYAPTALAEAPGTASALGLERLLVKMETARFGLPAFKILGASWATCRALSAPGEPAPTLAALRERVAGRDLALVTATDGNHGRAVAHTAALLGLRAEIFVPAGTAQARIDAIAGEGARVDVVDGDYDDAVATAAGLADATHLVISDTSWPGYEQIPRWVADGYQTIFAELSEQLSVQPDLAVVQIGVGALASALVRALARPGRRIVGVEPADAACALLAIRDGAGATAPGPHRSQMAGLNCGVASPVALDDMRAGIDTFTAISDDAMARALRLLHADGLACGETGVAGVAGLVALADAGEPLGAVALSICTEGPTDPDAVARLISVAP